MKIAIYPGSFDPITLGHLNIIERTAQIYDKLIVLVMTNSVKNPMFTKEERVEFIRRSVHNLPNVSVDFCNGLLADYAKDCGNCVIVKGLRAVTDFESEFTMSIINRKLNPNLDTMFLTADERFLYLSSSVVKEIGRYQNDLKDFLPDEIIHDVQNRFHEIYN